VTLRIGVSVRAEARRVAALRPLRAQSGRCRIRSTFTAAMHGGFARHYVDFLDARRLAKSSAAFAITPRRCDLGGGAVRPLSSAKASKMPNSRSLRRIATTPRASFTLCELERSGQRKLAPSVPCRLWLHSYEQNLRSPCRLLLPSQRPVADLSWRSPCAQCRNDI